MKILVTGSNGLLGQKLIALLQTKADIELIATSRGQSVIDTGKSQFISLDVTERADVFRILSETRPDCVINTAAMTQVDQCELDQPGCWKANVTSVENLVDACENLDIHLVHLSTDFVFDGSHGPLDELEKPDPVNYYGKSKVASEEIVLNSTLRNRTIIRTVLVYGITHDMSRSNIVTWVKNNLEQGKPIQVVSDQYRTPTLAEDLALGCYLAAIKKANGVYHISGKDYLSPYDIAIHTADFFKLDKTLISKTDSSKFTQPAKRPAITGFIIDKARTDLGYEPHSFEEGIAVLASQMEWI